MFPDFEEGAKANINDYTFEELSRYQAIYLSGFTYDSKQQAEALLLKLSANGIQIYIDMNKIPVDKATKQMELFDVTAQSIKFTDSYPDFQYNGNTYKSLNFSAETGEWNTVYLNGLEHVQGSCDMTEKTIPYFGTAKNENLHFIGLNIVYYLQTTRDSEMKKLVNAIFGMDETSVPYRKVVPVTIQKDSNQIVINSVYDNVNTTLSSIDIFSSESRYRVSNHLIYVDSGTTVIHIGYPHLYRGMAVTVIGFLLGIVTYMLLRKKSRS
jgi:uncharacterized membrane protein